MKRLPLLITVLAVIGLTATLAFWTLRWMQPPQRQQAAVPSSAAPTLPASLAAGLFGGQSTLVVASNYQLRGVVASVTGRNSVAILSVDGKPAQALAVGHEVAPGVTVREVQAQYVVLQEGGALKRIELASDGRPAMSVGGPTPPQPQLGNPAPAPVMPAPGKVNIVNQPPPSSSAPTE